jgi:hypothetical protein
VIWKKKIKKEISEDYNQKISEDIKKEISEDYDQKISEDYVWYDIEVI